MAALKKSWWWSCGKWTVVAFLSTWFFKTICVIINQLKHFRYHRILLIHLKHVVRNDGGQAVWTASMVAESQDEVKGLIWYFVQNLHI